MSSVSFLERIKLKARPTQDARDKNEDRSIAHLLRMARERPGDWTVRNDLADALAQGGRLDEAVTLLSAIADQ
jgi:Flp pilus assembly protein TadD